MNDEVLCELCRRPMKEIGPFATVKPEGMPSQKDYGNRKFQCLHEECGRYENIFEINISDLESYQERTERLCKCKHTRKMHDHRFSQFENSEPVPKGKKDINCKVSNCDCVEYIAQKEI